MWRQPFVAGVRIRDTQAHSNHERASAKIAIAATPTAPSSRGTVIAIDRGKRSIRAGNLRTHKLEKDDGSHLRTR